MQGRQAGFHGWQNASRIVGRHSMQGRHGDIPTVPIPALAGEEEA
jgi:hypothetical protein